MPAVIGPIDGVKEHDGLAAFTSGRLLQAW
jgi:hypothetical protein